MQKSGGSTESKALKELVELPCWKVIITLKEGNLPSADRKYVKQFQQRVARDKIVHKPKKTLCMAQTCHVKANGGESFGCRSSGVLATDATRDYILYLQGGAHIPDLGYSDCWQILLPGTDFLEGMFLSMND